MNTPVPGPPGPAGVDPAAIRATVDAALAAEADAENLPARAALLDDLHRTLSAALDTIDRA